MHPSNLTKVTLLIISMSYSLFTKAEHLMPIFSGYWYTEALFQDMNSCGESTYNYKNMQKGTLLEISQKMLSNLPYHANCVWGKIDLYRTSVFPDDFPEISDLNTWQEIIANPESAAVTYAFVECKNKDGYLIDSAGVQLKPSYICPPGSRVSVDNSDEFNIYCTTKPHLCYADIVGRNLDVPGFGFLGHVGLVSDFYLDDKRVYNGEYVAEVLKQPSEAIYVNTLASFKNIPNDPYWGAKYNLPEKNLSLFSAYQIMGIAMEQMEFPFEYTLTWDWHPGGYYNHQVYDPSQKTWQTVRSLTAAKFRCDSFVYYSYLMGANLHIFPNFTYPAVPRTMFNTFLSCRDKEGTLCAGTKIFNHDAKNLDLQMTFSAPRINIQQADYTTQAFLKNEGIPRAIKINGLWELALNYRSNPAKFSYLIDCLSTLRPIELTPDIIREFQSSLNTDNQRHLLIMMIDNLDIVNSFNAFDNLVADNQLMNIVAIQHFIRELLFNEKDKNILKLAIQLYPSIVTPERARQDITRALERIDLNNLQEGLFSRKEKMLLMIALSLASKDQQKIFLPPLINENRLDQTFNESLCFLLGNMPPEGLEDSSKEILSSLFEFEKYNFFKQKNSECNWLEAYAITKTNNHEEKEKFILNYILHENDLLMQAQLLSKLNWKLSQRISVKNRKFYRRRFTEKLKSRNFSKDHMTAFKKAISQLQ